MTLENLKEILQKHGASASKRWSQNFLYDESLLEKIASFIPRRKESYIEIGGGAGTLTNKVIEKGILPLTVLDIDSSMLKILRSRFDDNTDVTILEQDGATVNFSDHFKESRGVVFGNLPYQVGAPIMMHTFVNSQNIESAVFLLQKEVAEKVTSVSGSRLFSPLAALATLLGSAELLFSISPEAFFPAPKVWSSLIKIKFNKHTYSKEYIQQFASTVRILFSHRRKTLSNVFKINKIPLEILYKNGLTDKDRIEKLDWDTLKSLVDTIISGNENE